MRNAATSSFRHLRSFVQSSTPRAPHSLRLANRLDIHHTPKHGSWLNIAEIELSVLKGQCLNRRIAEMTTMQVEVAVWEKSGVT